MRALQPKLAATGRAQVWGHRAQAALLACSLLLKKRCNGERPEEPQREERRGRKINGTEKEAGSWVMTASLLRERSAGLGGWPFSQGEGPGVDLAACQSLSSDSRVHLAPPPGMESEKP